MLKLDEIRADLKDIRYYYNRCRNLHDGFPITGHHKIVGIAKRYHEAMLSAPIRLYDVYVSLYILNYTQEGLAIELNYTPEYVQMQHKKLLLFLQEELS